jgi:hypothetical protein
LNVKNLFERRDFDATTFGVLFLRLRRELNFGCAGGSCFLWCKAASGASVRKVFIRGSPRRRVGVITVMTVD